MTDRRMGRPAAWTDSAWPCKPAQLPHTPVAGKSLSREKAQPVSTTPSCSPPQPSPPLLLLSPTSGTFNPSFDRQPKKDSFHI